MQLSLANKYRPQTFDTMIGQQHIIGILKAKMQSSRDSLQNYLLTWPRGTGKTTSARILAKAINCLDPQNGNPCNHCVNCQTINEGKTLDYVEIDAASHTGVDNIREEILDKALYPPTALKKKIYVIDEVHMLSKGAFNSLLKTIEEPKGNVCFILATTEIQKVPDTIVSRCQTFLFRKVPEQEIADHLEEICKKEGFEYEKDALQLIAMISDGGVRDSIKYLDQVSILGKITTENVSKFLWIVSELTIKNFLEIIKKGNEKLIFDEIDRLNEQGIDLFQFAKQVVGFLDKHLLEDATFYLSLAEVFSAILRQIRFYPYPAVVFKMELSHIITSEATNSNIQPVIASETQWNTVSHPEWNEGSSLAQWPTPTEPPVATHEASLPPLPKGVWEQLLNTLPDSTLKSNLQEHTILEKIENGVAKLIVTNKIAEISLQKQENKAEIEKKLSEILGSPTVLEVTFESKEAYFARNLEL